MKGKKERSGNSHTNLHRQIPQRRGGGCAVVHRFSTGRTMKTGEEEWNDAWESDASFSLPNAAEDPQTTISYLSEEIDVETQAFTEDMKDNWDQRKGKSARKGPDRNVVLPESSTSSSPSSSLILKR